MKNEFLSLREHPDQLERFIAYFTEHWGNPMVYRDCMTACLHSDNPLPQWFMIVSDDGEIISGAGLIPNDFISRMDLCPWLCAVYVEEKFRHQAFGGKMIDSIADYAKKLGFSWLYCCTDHIGYYEKYQFEFIGTGYHPWNESSRIYQRKL